ncbi:hypothetical protein [Bifidobacterium cuniculi]|uniref:hypothetical protein n=1 Tax=Bifidobacterium cuniculi TaxID=1688 RepID=UPI0012E0AFE8|nr:hypothetical protein [Bifidobacterium cuniculi]
MELEMRLPPRHRRHGGAHDHDGRGDEHDDDVARIRGLAEQADEEQEEQQRDDQQQEVRDINAFAVMGPAAA